MADDWIKMRFNLVSDPDVIEMAEITGLDRFGVVGRLHVVWSWVDQHSTDGTNVRVTSAFLNEITSCTTFDEALRRVGWLAGEDKSLTFPNFLRHNGHSAKARASEAKRKSDYRSRVLKSNESGTSSGTNVPPSLGPEKRREEKKESPPTPQGVEGEAEAIFDLYPRKEGPRRKAIEAIQCALTKTTAETLRTAVIRFSKKPGLDRENGQFIPLPATWFDDERWKNYLPKPAVPVVHVPQPSKALDDLRWVFGRSAKMTTEEERLARGYIEQLTKEDKTFLTDDEKLRISNLIGNGNGVVHPTRQSNRRTKNVEECVKEGIGVRLI